MANHSKYYFAVEVYPPFVKPGKRITVKGQVCFTEEQDLGNGHKAYGCGAVVTDQPALLLDVMRNDGVSSEWKCVETKRFVPDKDGRFSFYIYTRDYEPSKINYLARFYAEGEDPAEMLFDQFVQVMEPKEYDEIMKAFKPFGAVLKIWETLAKRAEKVFKDKPD